MEPDRRVKSYKEILVGGLLIDQNSEEKNKIDSERRPDDASYESHYAPTYILRRLLQNKGIIEANGQKVPGTKDVQFENAFFQICKVRVDEYLKSPRILTVQKTGWEISYTIEELLLCLREEDPNVHFEIIHEELLSLIGFEAIEFLFSNQWGINLKEVLGEYEYGLLKREINKPPLCWHIQGYVQKPAKKLTARLNYKVLEFFSKKFPLPVQDFTPPKIKTDSEEKEIESNEKEIESDDKEIESNEKEIESDDKEIQNALNALYSIQNGHFQDWLTFEFVKDNNCLAQIVANALIKNSPSQRKRLNKANPVDFIKLEDNSGATLKLSFSHFMSNKKLRHAVDIMRFPLLYEDCEKLSSYIIPFIEQGAIDKVVKQGSVLCQLEICENDWKKRLLGFVRGKHALSREGWRHYPNIFWKKRLKRQKKGKLALCTMFIMPGKKQPKEILLSKKIRSMPPWR